MTTILENASGVRITEEDKRHGHPAGDVPSVMLAAADEIERLHGAIASLRKTQPAQSVKDAIIDDLQSQFDTEGITEHDSGDALIRLSDAIAAVEDNFAQPAPSVPEGYKLVPIEPTPTMVKAGLESSHVLNVHRVLACYDAMIDAAPEAKP